MSTRRYTGSCTVRVEFTMELSDTVNAWRELQNEAALWVRDQIEAGSTLDVLYVTIPLLQLAPGKEVRP